MSNAALNPPSTPDLYDADLYLWTQGQAALLRAGRWQEVDWPRLAEEIESVGGSQKSEIRNRLIIVLQHLLKWEFQPRKRKYGWRSSIVEQRLQIEGLLDLSPSLTAWPETALDKAYRIARTRAAEETGVDERSLPEACPYSLEQIMDHRFYPGIVESDIV
ncbi:DUF29 domain-containing protein [Methylobacterium sp. BTF04]|uniref:DUF29 domain-containing protein n=1 Tax=Methylobacterium sp. BTF04 TaxID=2708300 RepID=UPI0013D0618A|nr:DUF29 domain-containing protein [Methylobacterium sp. BTF04]NEU12853.1 DUF29 domain-containing protein [Methylobacterium sp. BTF04]